MEANSPPLEVKVWAPMACYTRPESKVERVSYSVPTPSAARGVLEAIFWKPEFSWRVREIVVLQPVRYVSLLRNEVEAKGGAADGLSITEARQQRHTLALRDVAYVIRADVVPRPHAEPGALGKYREQFRRHVEKGRCFARPFLGCREFSADFAPTDGSERPDAGLRGQTLDLGLMLFDLVWRQDGGRAVTFVRHGGRTENSRERREAGGTATPVFFQASLDRGVLRVPDALYAAQEALA